MPKSSRKKKDKVADFSKAKLRLGKGKRLPSNVIDTSFKARSIALPTQSITVEKDDTVPTNKRRQTFSDILSLLKHYSAGTRKDAIFSARELFLDHPELLGRSIAPLVNACARLVGDEDAGVRKTLLSFLDWIFSRLEKKDLIPHVPLLLLFTASAQTHIFPEIRIDAIRFLDLLLDHVPENVISGWNEPGLGHGKRILEGYLGILSAGTTFGGAEGPAQATSTSSVVLSPQSKLVILQSLSSFLSRAIDSRSSSPGGSHRGVGHATAPLPTWFLRSSFVTTRLYEEHTNVFQFSVHDKHLTWNVNPMFESFDEDFAYDPRLLCGEPEPPWDLSNLSDLSREIDDVSRALGDIPLVLRLSRTLYPTLTAAFLDGVPVVFSPGTNPTETEIQMLLTAFKITRTLYGAILQGADPGMDVTAPCEELKTLLAYLTGHFPFSPAHREVKIEQAFQDLSVIYCELTSLLVLVSHQSGTRDVHPGNRCRAPRHSHRPSLALKGHFSPSLQADLVESYVIGLLQGHGGSGAQLPRPISAVIYTALLPTVWALVNQGSEQDPGKELPSVLAATLDHAIRAASGSAVKRLTVEFVGRLLLLEKETGYDGHFNPGHAGVKRKFQEWIIHLPKTLWEVGTDNLATTQAILVVLLRLLQRGSHVVEREQISSLSSRLTPFFAIVHPIRGQVLGPFTKIPSSAAHVRQLALDLCASLAADQISRCGMVDDGLCNAVSRAVKGTREESYWTRVTDAMRGTL